MIKIKFLLVLFVYPMILFGQNNIYTEIVEDYCKRAELLEWKNKSVTEISSELSQIAVKIQVDHLDSINYLKENLKMENPELSEKEISKEFSRQLMESLLDSCGTYIQLSRSLLKPSPQENKTLNLIVRDVDSIIMDNDSLPYQEQLRLADRQIFNTILSNKSIVNKDYVDGFADPMLADESGLYLLHKSKLYYKAFAISESIKIINRD